MEVKKYKILVVDDEESLRRNIEKNLQREGYAVTSVNGINTALQALDAMTFDLVLLDLVMPDWTGKLSKIAGFQLLEQMRVMGYDVPVIMLTAINIATVATDALTVHQADNYLVKGEISQRKLISIVEETIKAYRAM